MVGFLGSRPNHHHNHHNHHGHGGFAQHRAYRPARIVIAPPRHVFHTPRPIVIAAPQPVFHAPRPSIVVQRPAIPLSLRRVSLEPVGAAFAIIAGIALSILGAAVAPVSFGAGLGLLGLGVALIIGGASASVHRRSWV